MAESLTYEFQAPLWVWEVRRDLWTFVTLPNDAAEELAVLGDGLRRGFGAVPVCARVGAMTWRTSVFPLKNGYVLPVKRAVRDASRVDVGDEIAVRLEVLL